MVLKTFGKIAATVMLAAALAGCIDAEVDVEVTSESTAKATMTQIIGADFYAMVKMNATESESAGAEEFCADGVLSEGTDGSATCVLVQEGSFEDLTNLVDDDNALRFTSAGPGLVRVALPTAEMKAELGAEDEMDEETRQMIEAFFAGHSVTIRVSGGKVTETNMTLAEDGNSAEMVLPFLDLINGTAELPQELYAVVRAP